MRFVPFPAIAYPAGWGAIPWGCANLPFPSRDAGHPARKLAADGGTLGCRDIPAQGLTPPLHPRKGFHPLTRFRWRVPVELRLLAYAEVAEHPVQQPLLHLVAGDFRQGQLG